MYQLPSFGLYTTGVAGGEDLDLFWKEFSRDASKYWDHGSSKESPRQHDFKHKVTKEPLWMDSYSNPSWVREALLRREQHNELENNPCAEADALSLSLIQACSKNKDLQRGTKIHNELRKRGLVDRNYAMALVTMYANCGELQKAQALLDKHNITYIVQWTALIAAYVREGKGRQALDCFERMQRKGILPNEVTYVCILKACAATGAIDKGKEVHDEILRQGLLEHHIVLGGALVHMYAKCGALHQAQRVLEKLPSRNVVCWNALIAGYAQKGQGNQALGCFERMQREGILANDVTYVCILNACAAVGAIDKGKEVHDQISRLGLLDHHIVLGSALVDMYAKCGALRQAQTVLEKLPSRNVVCWNALIVQYAQSGQAQQALDCFEQMQCEGIHPDDVTYASILKACVAIGAIDKGKQVHDEIVRQGLLEHHIVLGGALVDMYVKCGDLRKAHSVLEKLPSRNIVCWTALIAGYAQNGQGQQALDCFEQMQREGIRANEVTYVCILNACAAIGAIDKGKEVHDEISRQGLLERHIALGGALVDMYAKCGDLCQAESVLKKLPSRHVMSWTALIAGYVQNGQGQQALYCFEQMQCEGILADEVTYVCILNACAAVGAIDKGKEIHDEISRQGLMEHHFVLGGALVDMYAKCGDLCQAQSVLEKLPSRDVVCWNALIAGFAQNGQGQQALDCAEQMQCEGILPNEVTYACILKACAAIGAIDKGKEVHDEISRQGLLEHHIVLGGALVHMYAKCGALRQARSVLEKLASRAVVCWNALIAGYAQNGQGQQALDCFEQMQREGILPDQVTFCCLLNLCSHLGLVDKGQELFDSMETIYGLKPNIETFACMVDLLGRAGHLLKAVEVIEDMPFSADSSIWRCLLGACRKWVDVNVATWAFEQAVELDECDGAAYILMVNIYAAAGMPEKAKVIEATRIRNKAWKLPGCSSWTDLSNKVHEFCVGVETKHLQSKEIGLKLEDMELKMAQAGYFPNLNWVSRNISDPSKAQLLCRHSEKLALACALINTPVGGDIVIRKNMRMCGDCHTAALFASKTEKRKIVVIDAHFNHRFTDGRCSCNGYF